MGITRVREAGWQASETPIVESLDDLQEICGWLGTFRERLRHARVEDKSTMTDLVDSLEARYRQRRAELA